MSEDLEISSALLKQLKPFDQLKDGDIAGVVARTRVVDLPEGKILFKRDQAGTVLHWLLNGHVDVLDKAFNVTKVDADHRPAEAVLDDHDPYVTTVIATKDSRILEIDRADFEANVAAEEEEVDWMSVLLESHLFELVPPAHIQELFTRFEEVKYKAGDKVIVQGETGDYFYVLKQGQARIDRTTGDKEVKLAEVGPGQFFGEDALVREVPRNATITMTTKGVAMRLSKDEFQHLIQEHVNEYVTLQEVAEARKTGDQKLIIIDVRTPKEFKKGSIKSAVNIPIQALRHNLHKLRSDATYITTCDGGHRSELAAFIINKGGFDAYILKH